ncbi:MAG: LPXTG cell wall anchor domain-containing protein, partial [Arcanobacterium sp.]|nr:LPXTG cell wall anchor domain-containing protein [Arcanobacterium sp.]
GTSALATAGTKVEVVDGKFRVFRVGKDYKITGGNDTVTGTPDYVNGTNIGRVLPKDPTNTTKLPVGGLTPGQKDTYVFKAKVKQLSALKALGTGLCETNTPILNQVAAYDSVVNPNDASRDDAALTIECPKPAIALDKSTDFDATTAKVGDTVTYTFTVTNTGNIALETFTVNDPLPGLSEITYPADRTLAVGESKSATATYVLTDKDVVAGEIVNTATATGVPVDPTPNDKTDELPPNPTSDPDSETIVVTADPAFDFDKYIKDKAAYDPKTAKAGDVITYVFKVTNTGNITLSTFEINDPLPGLSEITYPANRTLAVGESKEATATYVLTDKDVVAGQVVNTATANVVPVDPTPEDPSDNVPPPAPKTDDENIVLTPNPDFDFDKSTNFKFADAKVGDTVTYNFKVTNTGNMTLSTFEINDPLPGLSKLTYPADRTLAVGESKTATATYVLTEADFAAGKVVNAAEASVVPVDPTPEDPSDNVPPPAPKTDEVEIPLTIKPGISLVKTAKQTMVNKVGEKIDYSFKVTNTGNTNLENITVSETAFTGKGALPVPVCPENVVLAPGESITCTAIYTVVKADIDAGVAIDNTAVATGEVPGGNGKTPPVTSDPSSATVKVSKSGKLAHTGAETTNALALAGLLLVAGATMSVRNRKQKA